LGIDCEWKIVVSYYLSQYSTTILTSPCIIHHIAIITISTSPSIIHRAVTTTITMLVPETLALLCRHHEQDADVPPLEQRIKEE
jgi:hypothetical protein